MPETNTTIEKAPSEFAAGVKHPAAPGGGAPTHVGVIGTGKISEHHLKFLESDRRLQVVGVCDLSPSLAEYAASMTRGAKPFTSYKDMLEKARPHVVHVLTPPMTHAAIIRDCLEAGCHVIAEKPLALSLAQFDELWDLSRRCGRVLLENQNYRFNRYVLEMKRRIDQGKIGDVREVEVRLALAIRGKGGRYADENLPHPSHLLPAGVVHEFITHLTYLGLMFGPEPEQVKAFWRNIGGGTLFRFDDLDAILTSGPARTRLRFTCHQAPDCFTITVWGTKGWLQTDLFQPYLIGALPLGLGQLNPLAHLFVRGKHLVASSIRGFWDKVMQATPYEGLSVFLARSYQQILEGGAGPISHAEMRAVARVIDALVDEKNRA
jgi:predicted dehydrogenase